MDTAKFRAFAVYEHFVDSEHFKHAFDWVNRQYTNGLPPQPTAWTVGFKLSIQFDHVHRRWCLLYLVLLDLIGRYSCLCRYGDDAHLDAVDQRCPRVQQLDQSFEQDEQTFDHVVNEWYTRRASPISIERAHRDCNTPATLSLRHLSSSREMTLERSFFVNRRSGST